MQHDELQLKNYFVVVMVLVAVLIHLVVVVVVVVEIFLVDWVEIHLALQINRNET